MLDFVSNYHDVRRRLGLGVRPAIIMRAPVVAQPKPVRLRSYPEPIGPMQPVAASDERRFGPRRIILAVAQVTGVTVDEIVSDARPQRISRARFLCYYMLRQHTSMSYPGIAAHSFPGRTFDHSTLIHGVKRIESALKSDKRTRDQVEAVLAILNGEGPEIGRELSTIDVPDWIPVEAVDAFMTCELERGRRRAMKWAYDRFRKRDVVRVRTTKPRPWFDSRNIIRPGKNALDFHLSFYMGYITSRNPDARIVVISNDRGYGPMLGHAQDLGFATSQVGFGKPTAKVATKKTVAKKAPAKKATAKKVPAAKKATVPSQAKSASPAAPVSRTSGKATRRTLANGAIRCSSSKARPWRKCRRRSWTTGRRPPRACSTGMITSPSCARRAGSSRKSSRVRHATARRMSG